MKQADIIDFATPIYYYEMGGQIKTVLDRSYASNYKLSDIFFITTAAGKDSEHVFNRALNGLEVWITCFKRVHFASYIFNGNVTETNEILGHHAMKQAYDMGNNL